MGGEVAVEGASEAELAAVQSLFRARELLFSRFRDDSELAAVNRATMESVVVSPLFARAMRVALAAAAETSGLVDPTMGAAIEAAGYPPDVTGRDSGEPRHPATWRSVHVAGRFVHRPPGTRLDLNGVVKAMTVDEAIRLLSGRGVVSAGGNTAVRGGASVQLPDAETIRIASGGLAARGSTGRRWSRDGTEQHELLDPRTGRPGRSRWRDVTVAAATCTAAGVAAKAAFLLSGEGPAWLDRRGLPGRFVAPDGAILENETWLRALARSWERDAA